MTRVCASRGCTRHPASSQTWTAGPKPLRLPTRVWQPTSSNARAASPAALGGAQRTAAGPQAAAHILRPVVAHCDNQLVIGIDEGGDRRLTRWRPLVAAEHAAGRRAEATDQRAEIRRRRGPL